MRASALVLVLSACGGGAVQDAGLVVDAGGLFDAGATDAGLVQTDGGVPDAGPCTPGSCVGVGSSANQWTCNPETRRCGDRPLCIGTRTCVYGLVCEFAECVEANVTGIGCANFANLPQVTAWNPATVTPQGPITLWVVGAPKDTAAPLACQTRAADFTVSVGLADNPMLPATFDLLPPGLLSYVGPDGGVVDVRSLARSTSYRRTTGANGAPIVTLSFNLCLDNPPAAVTVGFFAQNGNPVCAQVP